MEDNLIVVFSIIENYKKKIQTLIMSVLGLDISDLLEEIFGFLSTSLESSCEIIHY